MVSKISKGKWYKIVAREGERTCICTKGGKSAVLSCNDGNGKTVSYTIAPVHYRIVTEIPAPNFDDSGMSAKWQVKNFKQMEHARGIAWSLKIVCNGTDAGIIDNEGTGGTDNIHHMKRPYDQEFLRDAKKFAETYGMPVGFEYHSYLLDYLIDGVGDGQTPKEFLRANFPTT